MTFFNKSFIFDNFWTFFLIFRHTNPGKTHFGHMAGLCKNDRKSGSSFIWLGLIYEPWFLFHNDEALTPITPHNGSDAKALNVGGKHFFHTGESNKPRHKKRRSDETRTWTPVRSFLRNPAIRVEKWPETGAWYPDYLLGSQTPTLVIFRHFFPDWCGSWFCPAPSRPFLTSPPSANTTRSYKY